MQSDDADNFKQLYSEFQIPRIFRVQVFVPNSFSRYFRRHFRVVIRKQAKGLIHGKVVNQSPFYKTATPEDLFEDLFDKLESAGEEVLRYASAGQQVLQALRLLETSRDTAQHRPRHVAPR